MPARPRIGLNCGHEKNQWGNWRFETPAAYVQAVLAAGGAPLILPLLPDDAVRRELLAGLDGLVFIGSDDLDPALYGEPAHPSVTLVSKAKEAADLALMRDAVALDKPFLGICGGCQLLNVALGGSLWQDVPSMWKSPPLQHRRVEGKDGQHPVRVFPGTRLGAILGAGTAEVNSAHHQAVKKIGAGLVLTAEAPDGVPEAVELPGKRMAVGVQWHPERIPDRESTEKLFGELVRVAGA
jgi:putative glutamine amidotransferase